MERFISIVFDGPPSHQSSRFVEVEDQDGRGINIGDWYPRTDGLWALQIPEPRPVPAEPGFRLDIQPGRAPEDVAYHLRKVAERLEAIGADMPNHLKDFILDHPDRGEIVGGWSWGGAA